MVPSYRLNAHITCSSLNHTKSCLCSPLWATLGADNWTAKSSRVINASSRNRLEIALLFMMFIHCSEGHVPFHRMNRIRHSFEESVCDINHTWNSIFLVSWNIMIHFDSDSAQNEKISGEPPHCRRINFIGMLHEIKVSPVVFSIRPTN